MISIGDIYDKDVNFLFGSGASYGLFPTLQLEIQRDDGSTWSLEELATHFESSTDKRLIPLFMHYYSSCIRPAQTFSLAATAGNSTHEAVIRNYRLFLETLLSMLQRRKVLERRCNLFTTNYDGCFPLVADEILRQGSTDFVINDGTRGFTQRYLQARNFSTFLCQTGIFDRHQSSVPQINLIHLHGSVYWKKVESAIQVDYRSPDGPCLLEDAALSKLSSFSAILQSPEAKLTDLDVPTFSDVELAEFWADYQKVPIVNPTKWKFHETLYEEHYYQMLRLLSYELEKPNAVLITFGFSFADEHILNLVKRSLCNPHLQVFVCCYSESAHDSLSDQFRAHRNVKCVKVDDGLLDFSAFNQKVFTHAKPSAPGLASDAAPGQALATVTAGPASPGENSA